MNLPTKILLAILFSLLPATATSQHPSHQYLHKRTYAPAGYTNLFTTSTHLPSFDDCINYQVLQDPTSSNWVWECADICSSDKTCKFFAIWNTPSNPFYPFCGTWTSRFAMKEVTQSVTDGGESISNGEGFNAVVTTVTSTTSTGGRSQTSVSTSTAKSSTVRSVASSVKSAVPTCSTVVITSVKCS